MNGRNVAIALAVVALVVLALLGVAYMPGTPSGPPPPQPLPRSVLEHAAPAKPQVEAKASPEAELPSDMRERRERIEDATAHPTQSQPVIRQTPGIAPWKIVQHSKPGHDRSQPGAMHIGASYEGKTVRAHVIVDGAYRGESPLDLNLPDGDHTVRLDYGKTEVNQFITHVGGGGAENLDVSLRTPQELKLGHNPPAKASRGFHE